MTLFRKALATCLVLASLGGPAVAAGGIKVGTLNCDISAGVGLIITSAKDMTCTFTGVGGLNETYTGVIRKFGLDVGVTGKAKMAWVVFAPGTIDPGALRGNYVGASAEVAAGLGVGANALVGGSNKSIGLQPVSVQAGTGLNVAVGVSRLELN